MKLNKLLFATLSLLLPTSISPLVNAQEIEKSRSIYRNVVITENNKIRCMRFETRRKKVSNQACMDINAPDRIVFEYAQGTLAGFAHNPTPKRVLILGLGGGTLSNVINQISPKTEVTSVDIDPVVVKMAKKYFAYQESPKVKTEIKDARVYVKRALLNKQQFDWIILDAFNGDYIPEHLMTQEFLQEIKALLSDNGLVTANTFSTSELYDYESATYHSVFGKLYQFKAPTKGNRLIFACNCDEFNFNLTQPDILQTKLEKYQVDWQKITRYITDKIDWDTNSEVLTDQYSPANLLNR
ncbi:spermidine synthase [Catenovulum sediminis]|uniref:Fused MFS/spermidine synthase n=1 Tax=Catenovulum sediminis TaxID=1740262 RepID=A0ABV1RI27_9ALTE|nr:fused MFS/spermidine synthase [Catenovulum sediminis]